MGNKLCSIYIVLNEKPKLFFQIKQKKVDFIVKETVVFLIFDSDNVQGIISHPANFLLKAENPSRRW